VTIQKIMSYETEFILLVVWSIVFSPLIVGFSVLFLIKHRQSKEILAKPKGTFQEIFGL